MNQTLRPFSRLGCLLFVLLTTALSARAQLGRFRKVIWKIEPRKELSAFFDVTMYLIDKHGESVAVRPGENSVKWDHFTFAPEDGAKFIRGIGTIPVYRDLTGKDSVRISVTCVNSDLNSEFYVPVRYCRAVELNVHEIPYGGTVAENWEMVMNNGGRHPLDTFWVNIGALQNESDPAVQLANGVISLRRDELVPEVRLRFRDSRSGQLIVDQPLKVVYSGQVNFDFSGLPGRDGRNGQSAAIAGGTGTNGDNGENGLDAESVTVFVRPGSGDSEGFLEIIAIGERHRQRTFILPENATLNVHARGGRGGDGGHGGKGGSAAIVEDNATRRRPGSGGHGGLGGYGGNGGDVVVIIADVLRDTPIAVNVSNEGGSGGDGGQSGGRGSDPNRGLLERALMSNEQTEPRPTASPGYGGRSGSYFGERYVSAEEFNAMLREAGWR